MSLFVSMMFLIFVVFVWIVKVCLLVVMCSILGVRSRCRLFCISIVIGMCWKMLFMLGWMVKILCLVVVDFSVGRFCNRFGKCCR